MHGKLIWFSWERKGWKYKLIYEILIQKQYNAVCVDMRREGEVGWVPPSLRECT